MMTYEVWNFAGSERKFVSDDPVEIVHWIRSHPVEKRYFNVHPKNENFHRDKKIAHDFVSEHRMAAAEDIVKNAFNSGIPEGLAQELNDLFFGR
jgi:hypothetical protein